VRVARLQVTPPPHRHARDGDGVCTVCARHLAALRGQAETDQTGHGLPAGESWIWHAARTRARMIACSWWRDPCGEHRRLRRRMIRQQDRARLERLTRGRSADYGLTRAELAAEGLQLRRRGWTAGEIDRVLVTPSQVPESGWLG
jgi:hypothetical protein